MSLLAGAIGIGSKANNILGGLNTGECGKKCYGFGKKLTRCRRERESACEQEKARNLELELLEQQKAMNFQNILNQQKPEIAKAGMNPVFVLLGISAFLGFIFFGMK